MMSFFWFQNQLITNYTHLNANALDNLDSENAYELAPEFKKESVLISNINEE